jgi:hypothetical protein
MGDYVLDPYGHCVPMGGTQCDCYHGDPPQFVPNGETIVTNDECAEW